MILMLAFSSSPGKIPHLTLCAASWTFWLTILKPRPDSAKKSAKLGQQETAKTLTMIRSCTCNFLTLSAARPFASTRRPRSPQEREQLPCSRSTRLPDFCAARKATLFSPSPGLSSQRTEQPRSTRFQSKRALRSLSLYLQRIVTSKYGARTR
jgi:hypothetical protein